MRQTRLPADIIHPLQLGKKENEPGRTKPPGVIGTEQIDEHAGRDENNNS
jgi:hypothetical protein